MERESNSMQALCRSGCGFYGNPATDGLCSICYKEALKKKQQPPTTSPSSSVYSSHSTHSTDTGMPTIPSLISQSLLPTSCSAAASASSAMCASAQSNAAAAANNNSSMVDGAEDNSLDKETPEPSGYTRKKRELFVTNFNKIHSLQREISLKASITTSVSRPSARKQSS